MELNILGPLEVRLAGEPLDLGAPKQRAVLAFLAAHAGRPVSIDQLIEELWGDQAPPRATASLQAYVSNLRRLLEPDRLPRSPARLLVSRAPGYALDLPAGALDADRFGLLVAEVGEALAAGDSRAALAGSTAALALWRGGVLDDFAYEPFVTDLRARLDARRLHLHELRARALMAAGRPDDAAAELDPLTRTHPLHERLWELRMLACYRDGRQADALRAFQDARTVLGDELGLDPGPGLRELERRILDHDPALLHGDQAPPPAPGPSPASIGAAAAAAAGSPARAATLFGRDREVDHLSGALAAASAGHPTIVVLAGEAGIGKSALLDALAPLARAAGASIHVGRSLEQAGTAPLWPWVQIVRSLLGPDLETATTVLGGRAAHLAALLPGEIGGPVATTGPGANTSPADAAAAQLRLFDAVRALVAARAAVAPVVIALDDLHWADPDSLRLLDFLSAELRTGAVLVVGTFRDDEAPPGSPLADTLGSVARQGSASRLTLTGLDHEATTSFANGLAGTELDAATVDLLEAQTNGNPFFLGELVRLLTSEKRLDQRGAGTEVPSGVRDVVRRRVGRLPEDSQAVLRVAALIGREISVEVLARACELDVDHLLDALEPPALAGLLVEHDALGAGDRYRFSHALVAATLAEDLPSMRRRRLHARIGAAIEEVHRQDLGPMVAQLAFHYGEAAPIGHAPQAARFAEAAAGQAEGAHAFIEAVRFWRLAHDALRLDAEAPAARRIDVAIALAAALTRSGQGDARAFVAQAMDAALDAGDVARTARAAMALARHDTTWGWADFRVVHHDLVQRLDAALALAGPKDSAPRARLLSVGAFGTYYGDADAADAASLNGLTIARHLGNEQLLGECLALRLAHLQRPHQGDELIETATELIDVGRRVGSIAWQAIGLAGRVAGRFLFADIDGADTDHAAAMALLADHPIPTLQHQLLLYPSLRTAMVGDFDEAEHRAAVAREHGRLWSMWQSDAQYLTQLVDIRRGQGRLADLDEAIALMIGSPDAPDLGIRNLAVVPAIERGDLDEARRRVAGNGGIVAAHDDWRLLAELVYATDVAVPLGERATCRELYDQLLPHRGLLTLTGTTVSCSGPVDLHLGRLAGALGDREAAVGHLHDALDLCERIGASAWEAGTRTELDTLEALGARPASFLQS